VDRVSEDRLLELVADLPVRLVAEGVLSTESDAPWTLLADPLDGTRQLAHQKRSAWVLLGATRGSTLGSLEVSVVVEVPTVKAGSADVLTAVRGAGVRGERVDLRSGGRTPLVVRPSRATGLEQGYGAVARYFPGAREELAAIDDAVHRRVLGPARAGKAQAFEDQYCTGGTLVELRVGHDRWGLRPAAAARHRTGRHLRHPTTWPAGWSPPRRGARRTTGRRASWTARWTWSPTWRGRRTPTTRAGGSWSRRCTPSWPRVAAGVSLADRPAAAPCPAACARVGPVRHRRIPSGARLTRPTELERVRRRGRVRGLGRLDGPGRSWRHRVRRPGQLRDNVSAGAEFGYRLVWVIVLANVMAMLIQSLSGKIGLATGRNLPELCREHFPRPVTRGLWVQAELVAMATDLAEVIGGAIALHLLFGLPLLTGGVLTAVVAFALLALQGKGYRPFELAVAACSGSSRSASSSARPSPGWTPAGWPAGWCRPSTASTACCSPPASWGHGDAARHLPAQRPHPGPDPPGRRGRAADAAALPAGRRGRSRWGWPGLVNLRCWCSRPAVLRRGPERCRHARGRARRARRARRRGGRAGVRRSRCWPPASPRAASAPTPVRS
jgi:hypothetical protein